MAFNVDSMHIVAVEEKWAMKLTLSTSTGITPCSVVLKAGTSLSHPVYGKTNCWRLQTSIDGDINTYRVDIWRFGVLALELIYGGIRLEMEFDLLNAVANTVKNNAMPETLQKIKSSASGSSHDLISYYLSTVAG
ncbi:hypothetical protein OROMI_013731 [Orobanche minor]